MMSETGAHRPDYCEEHHFQPVTEAPCCGSSDALVRVGRHLLRSLELPGPEEEAPGGKLCPPDTGKR